VYQYLQVENIKNNILIMSGWAKSIMNLHKTQITEKLMQDNEIPTLINNNKSCFIRFKMNSILIR